MSTSTDRDARTPRERLWALGGVVTRPDAYRKLLYLAVALPLGVVYVVVLVTGFALGLGLSVVVVGLFVLCGVLAWSHRAQVFERRLADGLLDTAITASPRPRVTGRLAQGRADLADRSTWRGLAFLLLKLPVGVLSFALVASGLALTVGLLTMPLYYDVVPFDVRVVWWTIDTPFEALACVPLGALAAVLSLHLTTLAASASGRLARVSLARTDR